VLKEKPELAVEAIAAPVPPKLKAGAFVLAGAPSVGAAVLVWEVVLAAKLPKLKPPEAGAAPPNENPPVVEAAAVVVVGAPKLKLFEPPPGAPPPNEKLIARIYW